MSAATPIVNEILFGLRSLGLDCRSNPDSPDGDPWKAQCPECGTYSELDELPLTITSRGFIRCAHGCDQDKIAAAAMGQVSPAEPSGGEAVLRFMSAAELKAHTPAEPDWIVEGYLALGNITLLAGKPKAGKSRLCLDLTAAVAHDAGSFLGKPLYGGAVVYVSEEGAATLAHKLPDSERVSILTRENAWPKPEWSSLVEAAVAEAERIGAKLLVIDTLAYWAGMPAEREKDSGAALAVMDACVFAARTGLAVLVPTHTRKGGGEDGEGVRGSSAFVGSADIILELERVPDAAHQRALLALSRHPRTPGTLVAELNLDTGVWHVVSEDIDRSDAGTIAKRQREAADRDSLLTALDAGELTRAELEEITGTPARQWHSTLEALIKDKVVKKTGAGKKGDPYRFEKVRTDAAHNGAESDLGGIHVSAAPRRGAETESTPAAILDAALCAETQTQVLA
jgi:AAA domain